MLLYFLIDLITLLNIYARQICLFPSNYCLLTIDTLLGSSFNNKVLNVSGLIGFFTLFQILKDCCWHFIIKHGVYSLLVNVLYCVK